PRLPSYYLDCFGDPRDLHSFPTRRSSDLALILMTARRLGEGERLVRAGKWEGWHPVQMLGTHVSGKTVGILGFGRIGKAIARRRSEEHTSELQSRENIVCRLLLEKKKNSH